MIEYDELEQSSGTEDRLQTALSEFCSDLPAFQLESDDRDLRQVAAFGARVSGPHLLHIYDGGWLCIETKRRRVHAFRWEGQGVALPLPRTALSRLAALSDAASLPYGPSCAVMELDYHPRGWRLTEPADDLPSLLEFFDEPTPSASGPRLVAADCQILAAEPEEPTDALLRSFLGRYPEFDNGADRATCRRELRNRARPVHEAFLAGLQPLAVDACRRLHCRAASAFNAFAHEHQRVALYRAQVASAVPMIGKLLAQSDDKSLLPLRLAVDMRLELASAGAAAFGVNPEAIRFLAGVDVDEMGLYDPEIESLWMKDARFVLSALAAIEPSHRPQGELDWAAFHALLRPMRQWRDHFSTLTAPFLRYAGRRGFPATVDAVHRRLGHLENLAAFGDYLECLEKAVQRSRRPGPEWEGPQFRRDYAARRGLLRLAVEAHRWRAGVARETARRIAALEQARGRDPFTLPFPMPSQLEGLRFVFLDTGAALVAESLRMSHCIEQLYPQAAMGERLAFSIRTLRGEALATFDVSFQSLPGGWRLSLNELSGPRNGEPSPEAAEAAHAFVKIVSDELAANPGAVERWKAGIDGRRLRSLQRDSERFARFAQPKPFVLSSSG